MSPFPRWDRNGIDPEAAPGGFGFGFDRIERQIMGILAIDPGHASTHLFGVDVDIAHTARPYTSSERLYFDLCPNA